MTSRSLPALTRWLAPTVPVLAVAGSAVALVGLLAAVLPGDRLPLLPVQLIAVALAASAAYVVDDGSRQVTDVVPHSLLQRRLVAALPGGAVIAVAWTAVVVLLLWQSSALPVAALTWQTAGLGCVALATSALVALRGEAEPGNLVAATSTLIGVGILVIQPIRGHTLLADAPEAPVRAGWWLAVIAAAITAFVLACVPLSRRRRPRSPAVRNSR